MSMTRKWLFHIMIVSLLFIVLQPLDAKKKKYSAERDRTDIAEMDVVGKDPQAFKDAVAMMSNRPTKILGPEEENILLNDLQNALNSNQRWGATVWTKLTTLAKIVPSSEALLRLSELAESYQIDYKPLNPSSSNSSYLSGNKYYRAGEFQTAIQNYMSALNNNAIYWDAMNNLGLAAIHSSQDALAYFVLKVLLKNKSSHIGAAVNLGVCLERLGYGQDAFEITRTHQQLNLNSRILQYNLAWFHNSRSELDIAHSVLDAIPRRVEDKNDDGNPVQKEKISSKLVNWLQTINSLERGSIDLIASELEFIPSWSDTMAMPIVTKIKPTPLRNMAWIGNTKIGRIPVNTELVVSERNGDWVAVYWPWDGVKHRVWLNTASIIPLGFATGYVNGILRSILGSTVVSIYILICLALITLCLWSLFVRAGRPGWTTLVPIANVFIFLRIIKLHWAWFLVLLIPYAGIVILVYAICYNMAISYGKTSGFAFWMFVLFPIIFPIFALGHLDYQY